jgi:hypothetical protein
MKQVEKNEVDLLLRALAKRHGRAAGDPEGQLQGEHQQRAHGTRPTSLTARVAVNW